MAATILSSDVRMLIVSPVTLVLHAALDAICGESVGGSSYRLLRAHAIQHRHGVVELTAEEIVDLARYIHFLRQQARLRELSRVADARPGDRTAGEAYFNGAANCRSCHSVTGDLAGIGRKYDAMKLRERLLRPGPSTSSEGVSPTPGQAAHLKLLENYTAANVEDLLAYLGAIR